MRADLKKRIPWGWLLVALGASGAYVLLVATWLESTFAGVPLVIFPLAGLIGVAMVPCRPILGWGLIIGGWTLTLFILGWFLLALRTGATGGLSMTAALVAASIAQGWGAEKIEDSLKGPPNGTRRAGLSNGGEPGPR
jgi:hypothetical protein